MKIILSRTNNFFRKSILMSFLLLLFLINFTDAEGQVLDSLRSNVRYPRVDSSMTFLTSTQTNTLRIEFHPPNRDTVFVREYKDSIGRFDFNLSHTASQMNIQYVNDTLWYIYGTRTEYAYYPCLLRTTNSAESWQTIIQSWPDKFDQPMGKNMFHMFDMTNGIWINGLHNNKINYRITNDGGFTWKNKSFRVKNGSELKNGRSVIAVKYYEDNSIQISIYGYLKNDGKWTKTSVIPDYTSNDFGGKFKKVN